LKSISILLADDHALVRAGIRAFLERLPEVTVIAEAKDGNEACQLAKEKLPDLVLMDIAMPGLNGLAATARIRKDLPDVRVIVLSMYTDEAYVSEAIGAGAAGYLLKRSAAVELEDAIKAVANGGTYFSAMISKNVTGRPGQLTPNRNSLDQLTPRQREILKLIADRQSTREIAGTLEISVKTVETHRAQLMERLNIHDIPGLVRFAIRAGLVSIEE
jgi:DNA-binding NarL/FixJ family response regulator